jgi:hypothetical protein
MNLLCTDRTTTGKPEKYATSCDFAALFTKEMSSLYQLSFLLTSNHHQAEQCFVAGAQTSMNGNPILKELACSWARRKIVENAIRMIAPRPNHASGKTLAVPLELNSELQVRDRNPAIASVLELPDFERFTFVMSVLERYPDLDCSVLLACAPREIRDARVRALQQISEPYTKSAVAGRTVDLLS